MKIVVFLLLFVLFSSIAYAENVAVGQKVEIENREILIKSIGEDSIAVSVEGVKQAVKLNRAKDVNGIKILVTEIFYSGDMEGRSAVASFSLSYKCGDDKCSEYESENCCLDCGCKSGLVCGEDNKCFKAECSLSDDCGDNNALTVDTCVKNKCEHDAIECNDNKDCEDNTPDTIDECRRRKCYNSLEVQCKANEDCDDNDECTSDECKDNECFNTRIPNCNKSESPKGETNESVKEVDRQENAIELDLIKEKPGAFKRFFNWFLELFS
jgi:hypothetical protein